MIWLWFACGADNVENVEPTVQLSTTIQEEDSVDCTVNEAQNLKVCAIYMTEVIPRIPQLRECDYNPRRCFNLGYGYDTGTPDKGQSDKIAAVLYQFACEGGFASGCTNLGYMYRDGQGVSQNYDRAIELYQQGCEGGSAGGCFGLGHMYGTGKGVSRDYDRAVELFKQSCDGGNASGCSSLGNYYRLGISVSQDTSLARKYLQQGCDGGYQWGCDRLQEMD